MKKSYITILLLLMVMILGISAASAADIDDTSDLAVTQDDSTILEVEDASEEVQAASDDEVMADSGEGNNFTSLKTLITEAGSSLTLTKDYTRVAGDSDIEINKDFTIDGQDTYTIDANNLGGIFKVNTGYTLTLTGVTLINGNSNYGGAVYVENGATLNVENSKFNQNTAVYRGGAIYSEGTVDVKDSIFKYNDITHRTQNLDYGGAGIANIDGTLTVDNCEFSDNVKDYVVRGTDGKAGDLLDGAAILTTGDTTITNSDFFNNSACYGGAFTAIPITSRKTATITIDNCNFTDNLAYTGAAMYIGWNADYDYTISNSWFENNLAMGIGSTGYTAAGGAILSVYNSGSGSITKSTFKDNKVKDSTSTAGGAITIEDTSSVTIEECVFDGNTADYIGGAVEVASGGHGASTVSIDKSNFTNNAAGYGGAVFSDSTTTLTVSDSLFEDNTATSGANSIYNMGDMTLTDNEFAADQDVFSTEIVLGTFTDLQDKINNAEGALDLAYDYAFVEGYDAAYANGVVIANPITINGNGYTISGSNAARIFNVTSGKLTLNDVTLTNGLSDYGGAIYVSAGASLDAQDVELYNNTAVYRGGAIYSEGTVTVENTKFDGNDITFRTKNDDNGGAAIYNLKGVLNIIDSTITNNLKDIIIRNGNAGDLLVGVVVTTGETLITGSYFANNTGSWGGAISSLGYMNTEAYTLTIKDSKFDGNNATFGGAIYVESSELVIDNCTFENNKGVGVGSSGTSNTQGGAIVIHPAGASATITDSTFIANSANVGGAVSLAGVDGDSIIENCTFTDNTANDGGAVYLWTQDEAAVTVANSTFSGNTAGWGSAISTDGTLKLSNNTISGTSADIGNWGGSIISEINVVILNNETVTFSGEALITAKVTDDNNNIIKDINFVFVVNETQIDAVFNTTSGLYQAIYKNDAAGLYVVNITHKEEENLVVKTGTLKNIKGTFTDLANIIANADSFTTTVLDGDYTYNEEFDSDLVNGIVIDKEIILDGNGSTISGNGLSRIFNITGGDIILHDTTLRDAVASYGGAVYVDEEGEFTGYNVNFINNTAVYRGGAIYSEGLVQAYYSVFDSNDITFRTANDDNGGAAIYNNNGFLAIADSNITNNLKDIVIRNGNAGDLLVGVVVTSGDTFIINSYFANNTGSWGGAISSLGYMNPEDYTVTIRDSKFEGNNATFGGAIYVESANLIVENSTFENNKGVGVGSSGTSNTQGGAIVVHPSGSSATITDSTFIANSANVGGAVSLAGVDGDSIIENCTFTDNTANDGGAVYLWTQDTAVVTVANSTFSGNTAGWGNAISTDGALALSNNTISSTSADIGNWGGSITSYINATILGNDTVSADGADVKLTATIVDDNGNVIMDHVFNFIVNGVEVPAAFNYGTNLYEADYTLPGLGIYVVGMSSMDTNVEVFNGTISYIKGTFTELANMIANVETGKTIVLDGDFAYDPEIDADLIDGIVIDKDIAIDGDGYTINGNNAARIFKVTGGNTLALTNASLVNGYAEYGGAIYVDASNLVLDNCTLDSNNVFDLTGSNPNELGGAAIHAVDSTVTITDSYITNNGDKTLDRSNNQVINGVVNLINSNTEITRTLFENNTGIYGGAVFAKGGSLEVSDSQFINNTAYVGAGIRTEGTTLTVTGSKFEENEGRGTGSEGTSKNSGAAICSNGDASINITSSNFTRNSAENGGAINTNVISSSNTVEIDNCIFTDNVATEKGGAILVNNDAAETIISNSNFTGNDGVLGSAIFNLGTLSLSKNNIDEAGAITSGNVIASNVIITVLDNENATYNTYDKIADFYAQLTDDNGNVIVTSDNILKIGFGTSTLSLEYDETDGLYHKANVKVVKSGAPSLPSATKNLFTDITFESPYITAIKLNATLEVEYENVTDQDDVVIGITLTGKEGETAISAPSGSSKFTITVNNVPYSVKITKGIGSLTISDLPAGDYVINASWTGNTYYNPIEQLYNLTVSPKKGTFTELKYLIDNNDEDVLVLPYDFAYDDEYDVDLIDGIVIDKDIAIDANGFTISGNNIARLFKVDSGNTFTLNNASLVNGNADSGSAIYNEGIAYISNSTFTGNVALDDSVIYNKGTLNETKNTIDQDNNIYSTGKITSIVKVVYNDDVDIYCNAYDTIDFTVKFVDDNNNLIRFNVNSLRVYVGNKGTPLTTLTLDKTTGVYKGSTEALTSGQIHLENLGRWFIDKGYVDNGNFKRSDAPQIFIEKVNATLTVDYENITYGEDAVINVTLTGFEGRSLDYPINIFASTFTITVNEKTTKVAIKDSEGQLIVSDLPAGEYVIKVNFAGDKLYNPIEQEYTLKVDKVNVTEFGVFAIDTLEGENATVWLTLKANETGLNSLVTVIVNNKEYAVIVENGEGNLTVEGLTHGQYPVVAILDDPNYNYLINSSVFFVKGQAKLNITELTVAEYGDVIEIAINLTGSDGKPLTGVVVVDDVINVLVENGIGTFVIDNQPDVGNYTFQAVYDGDNDYFGDLAIFNVTINTKVIDPEDIVVDIPNINEFGKAIPITITSPVDGIYIVNINGTPVEVEVVNGVGNATITLDEPGIYNATVDIADEGYSLETITTDEFEYLVTPEFNVEITGTYPEAEISITGPAGTYHIIIDGMEPVDITREESGLPTFKKISMDAGDYTAYVSFDARDEYYGDYKEINFTVNKATLDIEEPEVIGDKVVESPINITFTLPADVDLSSVTAFMDGVSVPIDEFVINETTGVYTLPLDGFSATGGHLFTVQVNDPNYEEAGAQVSFTIEKITPTLEVNDTSGVWNEPVDIPVKLTDANGNPITGKVIVTVSWRVDGVTQVVNLDENGEGIASFNINQAIGDLTIDATFDGNDKYNATKANATLYIKDVIKMIVDADSQVDYNDTFYVNVTLSGALDEPMAHAVVSYAINEGEAQTISTDENGYVSIPVTGLAAGESSIVVSYDDESGNVTTKTVAVNVNQILPVFTSQASENNVVGQNVTITVNAPGATGNVTLTVDGEQVGNAALDNGVVVFEVSGMDAGHHSYVAIYDGNENYTTTSDLNSFDVAKAETTVTIEADGEIGVMGGATVNVTVSDNVSGYISIDNDGTVSVVEITNGTYSFEIYDLQAGNYSITVTFLGNDNYLKSNATKVLNIPKSAATPEITDVTTEVILGEDAIVLVDMNNDFASGNITVFVDGVENQTVDLDDYGLALVTIPGLTIGDHTIGVKYNGNDNYNASDIVTHTINVAKAGSKVTIDPIDNVAYGEEVYILYTVENKTNVKITVYDNTGVITPVMDTADGFIGIKGLKPGDYQIMIENEESNEYKESYEMGYFTVGKAASSVTIVEIDDLVYPGTGEVLYEIENKTEDQSIIVTFNGNVIVVPYDEDSIQLTDLAAGEYTITIKNYENELYNGSEAAISFKVVKADPTITAEVATGAKVGDNVTITITAPADATGNVSVAVDGIIVATDVPVVNGAATVNVTGLAAGHHSFDVTYAGDDNYNSATYVSSFDVDKVTPEIVISDPENPVVGHTVQATVTVAGGDATGYVIFNKVAYKLENGQATIDVGISEAGIQTITVEYLGDDKYTNGTADKTFNAAKAPTEITLDEETLYTVVDREVEVKYTIDPMVSKGNVTLWIDDVLYYNNETSLSTGSIVISGDQFKTNGTYTVKVQYIGTDDYADSENATLKIIVEDETVNINITVPENTTTPVFNITVPTDAGGLLLVDVDGKHYYAPVENGTASITVPGLEPGNYTANVTYTGDEFYDGVSKTVDITVPANADENSITIPEGATTTNPTFSINLPSDATGYFEVDVDGKKYVVPVENGTASISVPGLAAGDHNVTVKYSGDGKYNSISKSTTLNLKEPVPKLSENKYIKVVYSGTATYKVRLTLDGKAAAGKYVTINYNGKNYNVKTDSKGYATLKLNTKVKPKTYTVTATYKGVKVTSKVKVKHVIKAKNKKAKKSKKLKLKVKLKKVDGKVLKNKKVKLKFKGKKYTAKTNKKGKATFTIKKKVMKKLKKGKKYKYKVYYGKDKVTKKIKVKK